MQCNRASLHSRVFVLQYLRLPWNGLRRKLLEKEKVATVEVTGSEINGERDPSVALLKRDGLSGEAIRVLAG